MMTNPAPPDAPDAKSWQLLTTLGLGGALAGLLIVFVFEATQPGIQRHRAEVLRLAVQEVLEAPDRYDTLYVYDGVLTLDLPAGVDGAGLEQVYLGYSGVRPVGFAVAAGQPGFQDIVRIIFGYDPVTNSLLGMRVLESKETPGLGDKIEKDLGFVSQFDGAEPPLLGVKRGRGSGAAHEVDMITGATISSRTIVKIINSTLERLGPMMTAYGEGGN